MWKYLTSIFCVKFFGPLNLRFEITVCWHGKHFCESFAWSAFFVYLTLLLRTIFINWVNKVWNVSIFIEDSEYLVQSSWCDLLLKQLFNVLYFYSKILFRAWFVLLLILRCWFAMAGYFYGFQVIFHFLGTLFLPPHRAISRCKSFKFQLCFQTFIPPGQLPTDSVLFAVSWWACKIWPNQFNKVSERVKIALINHVFSKLARVP